MAVQATILFIACHGGPADHFATFAEGLTQQGYNVQVCATGPALQKFQDRKIQILKSFSLEGLSNEQQSALATELARTCQASVVMTDVGHSFAVHMQQALSQNPTILRCAYYDNPEAYVPGGYSEVAAKVMTLANKVFFANDNLASSSIYSAPNQELNLDQMRIGLGYYPVGQAQALAMRRKSSQASMMRSQFLLQHGIADEGQKVLAYFGGNNEEYFNHAFPAFLHFLEEGVEQADLSHWIIAIQQHPGAKTQNRDGVQVEQLKQQLSGSRQAPTLVMSGMSSDAIQVIADGGLYYQTSMGPLLTLANLPLIQVGHKTYFDLLVKNGLCPSVTGTSSFITALQKLAPIERSEEDQKRIYQSLGIRVDWLDVLKKNL